jgi:cobalamin-dependent methionine synthase I
VESCLRAYQLLRSKLDFPKEDIIFDCLLTPVGSEVPASVKDDQRKNGGQDLKCAVQ